MKHGRRLQRWLFRRWELKLAALGISIVLYILVTGRPPSEVILSVPLEYRNIAPGMEIIGGELPEVEVRLRGPANFIRQASPQNVVATINLAKAMPGEHTYDLTRGAVEAPFGLKIVEIYPSAFRLQLDESGTRMLPVRIHLSGTPAAGMAVANAWISPGQVQVQGPRTHLRQLQAVDSDPVSVAGLHATAALPTRLFVPDPYLHLTGSMKAEVHVALTKRPAGPRQRQKAERK